MWYLLILYVYVEKGFGEDVGLLKTFSVTDIGKKRKLNQDYIFSSDRKILPSGDFRHRYL